MSNDFIFKKQNNKLQFIGDFEGLYQNDNDPWGQSGEDERLRNLYKSSRECLVNNINQLKKINTICEIGCGLGFVSNYISSNTNKTKVDGIDISPTAIKKARINFPNLDFYVENIANPNFSISKKYDIVILNQILWYILEDLQTVFKNIENLIIENKYLVISTLFLKNQQYGKEIIGSFDELVLYCINNGYKLIHGNIVYDENSEHHDSILILQKR